MLSLRGRRPWKWEEQDFAAGNGRGSTTRFLEGDCPLSGPWCADGTAMGTDGGSARPAATARAAGFDFCDTRRDRRLEGRPLGSAGGQAAANDAAHPATERPERGAGAGIFRRRPDGGIDLAGGTGTAGKAGRDCLQHGGSLPGRREAACGNHTRIASGLCIARERAPRGRPGTHHGSTGARHRPDAAVVGKLRSAADRHSPAAERRGGKHHPGTSAGAWWAETGGPAAAGGGKPSECAGIRSVPEGAVPFAQPRSWRDRR
jgi:hypothetical protein